MVAEIQEIKPSGEYLLSELSLHKAEIYLHKLKHGLERPGHYLSAVLKRYDLQTMASMDLIVALMNTRKACIFAESATKIDGSDWSSAECEILGGVSYSTRNTCAYNNGGHQNFKNHSPTLPVNYVYVAGALLRNDHSQITPDMRDVICKDSINIDEDAYYRLYENRLLPGLIAQNDMAKKPLVVNIPGLGLGQFCTTQHRTLLQSMLPRVLKKIIQTHGHKLTNIRVINYDPYAPIPNADQESVEQIGGIRFQTRPYRAVNNPASQLEFPKDGNDYADCQLVKVIAWDHFSYPGNDIWRNARATDDGVTGGSSDLLLALANSGEFGPTPRFTELEYHAQEGIAYAKDRISSAIITYSDLAQQPHSITKDMIRLVNVGLSYVKQENHSMSNHASRNNQRNQTPNPASSNNAYFQLQCIKALVGLGLALFALAVMTCTPIASALGIASAFTANISTVSTIGSIASLLAAAGVYAFHRNRNSEDADVPTLSNHR